MLGMRRGWLRPTVLVVGMTWAVLGSTACNRSTNEGQTTAPTRSSEGGETRSARPSRGEVACHLHSCAPPKYCNRDKGICELLPCTDSRDCPYGYKCDFARQVCR